MAGTGALDTPRSGMPHVNVESVTLLTPNTCSHCGKFIWGVYKQAQACSICNKHYHQECLAKAGDDCVPPPDTSTAKNEMLSSTGPHEFVVHTYAHPTWCQVCSKFVWGFSRQGYQCSRCGLDAHKGCLGASKSKPCLSILGGSMSALTVPLAMIDPSIAKKVTDRRTTSRSRQTAFKRIEQYRLNMPKNNIFLGSMARASIMILPQSSEAVKIDDLVVPATDAPSASRTSSSSSLALPKPSPPPEKPTEQPAEQQPVEQPTEQPAIQQIRDVKIDVASMRRPSQAHDSAAKAEETKVSPVETKDEWQAQLTVLEDFAPTTAECILDDFEITEKELGRGQFGVVKVACNKKSNQKLAVKIVDKKRFWGRKPESTRHLKREIAILGQLKHPQVIHLFAVFDEREMLFMFMELVEGGDLLAFVEKRGRVSEDEGKFLFHQLAVGVKYLHDRGVVHRDLKPENLLLSMEDNAVRLKIADFGFANIVGGKDFLRSVVGTPAYVAPEILNKSSKGYSKAADLWSTGVILYACLGGVFPFDESEPVEEQIMAGKFNFPDEYFGDVSDHAIDLCCNLLVVDPRTRFTADDVLRHPWLHVTSQLTLSGGL